MEKNPQQKTSDEAEIARSLLDQLLTDSRLYTQSQDYKDLLDFMAGRRYQAFRHLCIGRKK